MRSGRDALRLEQRKERAASFVRAAGRARRGRRVTLTAVPVSGGRAWWLGLVEAKVVILAAERVPEFFARTVERVADRE